MSSLFSESLWEAAGIPTRGRGRPRHFDTPEEMIERAVEYFRHSERTTIDEVLVFANGSTQVKSHPVPFLRKGLLLFLGLSDNAYQEYRAGYRDKKMIEDHVLDPDETITFAEACAWMDQVIAHQKMSGAVVGIYNAQMVGRILGLAERSEISGPDGGPIETSEISPREIIERRLARLAATSATDEDPQGAE